MGSEPRTRSRRARQQGAVCVAAWLLASFLGCPQARADAAPWPRVLVRLESADQQLFTRMRGQLSDVEVELVASDPIAIEPNLEAQVQAARALADTHAADGVVWLDRPPAGSPEVVLHVLTAKTGEVTTRRIEAKPRTRSELFEAVALVTRTAVSAFARAWSAAAATRVDTSIGNAASERASRVEPAPSAFPTPATQAADNTSALKNDAGSAVERKSAAKVSPTRVATRAATSAGGQQLAEEADPDDDPNDAADPADTDEREEFDREVAGSAVHAQMFAGAQSVVDGASELGQKALAVRLGCSIDALSVAFFASAALMSTIQDRLVNLQLARHAAGVAVQLDRPFTTHTRWALGLHAGAVLLSRTSSAKIAAATDTGTTLLTALAFGPELSAMWLPGSVGLGLHVALDVMPNAPSFALRGGTETHALWVVEPRVSLGVEARL